MAISCIIIDDEEYCIDSLAGKLQAYAGGIKILATCTVASEATALVVDLQPSLVFLDINLGSTTAFELLEKWQEPLPRIIFTTAYDNYAIKAFRYNAIDYLMKPIDEDELERALKKVENSAGPWPQIQQMRDMIDCLNRKTLGLQKIALPTLNGFELVAIEELIRLEAASNYTHFYLQDGKKIITSKTLKEYESILGEEDGFMRVHQSHIINMRFIKSYSKGRTPVITLVNGDELDVSATRKDLFEQKFRSFFKVR